MNFTEPVGDFQFSINMRSTQPISIAEKKQNRVYTPFLKVDLVIEKREEERKSQEERSPKRVDSRVNWKLSKTNYRFCYTIRAYRVQVSPCRTDDTPLARRLVSRN